MERNNGSVPNRTVTPDEILDSFFADSTALFFLVPRNKATADLESRDFAKEKRTQGLGIICWSSEAAAARFLEEQGDTLAMTVVRLTSTEFNDLMDKNDPDRSDFDGFFLRSGERLG